MRTRADDERPEPHDVELERRVLGAMIAYPSVRQRYLETDLQPGDFYRQAHRVLFLRIRQLEGVDERLLIGDLERSGDLDSCGGSLYVTELTGSVPIVYEEQARAHVNQLRVMAAARRVMAECEEVSRVVSADPTALTNGLPTRHRERFETILQTLPTDAHTPAATSLTDAPTFIEQALNSAAPPMLVDGLVPGDGITLDHGQPRDLKTWKQLEVAVCLSAGVVPFHREHADTREPVPVVYCTNEDPPHRIAWRLSAIASAHGLAEVPRLLHVAVHAGLWLDDPEWQARLISDVKQVRAVLTIIDPARSVTGSTDQGPREFQPFGQFLRRLQRETGSAIVIAHHDTKPSPNVKDNRKRPQRASGGGLFSYADAPVHFERVSESPARSILRPSGWKFYETPGPLELTLTVDHTGARVTARAVTAEEADTVELHDRIIEYLQRNHEASGTAIAKSIRAGKASVLQALERLYEAGRVDSREGPRNAQLWFLNQK